MPYWATIRSEIPERWRMCGENLFARHSIGYDDLKSFFYGFSVWNEENLCLAWDETLEWFGLVGIVPVPVLFDGTFDEKAIRRLWDPSKADRVEGYVVRVAGSFPFQDFSRSVAKFVRKNHVKTNEHWMHSQIFPNRLGA